MRLIDLQIEGFGKLSDTRIGFTEGTNLISGPNEAGKSTVYACLRAMFFGMVRAKGVAALTDTYSHFKPWFARNYGAALRVEKDGHVYCIRRDFLKDPVGCSVYDETAMEAVPYADRFVSELILDMSEKTYDNTVSISKLKTDAKGSLSGELKKYIVNMDTTGSHALNCTRARAYLCDQKRKLLEGISPDAAREYALNCSELKRLENSIRDMDAVIREVQSGSAGTSGDRVRTGDAVTAESGMQIETDFRPEGNTQTDSEAKEAAEELRKLKEEQAALATELQCLDAQIIKDRESLRAHSVYSSEQVRDALSEFHDRLEKFQSGSEKKLIGICRILYIALFVLGAAAILATAYASGSGFAESILQGCRIMLVLFFVLAAASLAFCIVLKKKYASRYKEFARFLGRYTGYDEVSEERISRVRTRLEELQQAAAGVEDKEEELAQLSRRSEANEKMIAMCEAAAPSDEAAADVEAADAADEAGAEADVAPGAAAGSGTAGGAALSGSGTGQSTGESDGGALHPQTDSAYINDAISRINAIRVANVGLKELLGRNDAINEEVDAIDLALEKIDELADTMKDSLGVHLNASASEYIREITNGAYDSLSVDDDLNVYLNTKEKMVPIEQVSNGTSDQIYMALRLAGARLIQNGEDTLPLIFDDSFVNYDDARLASALTWLVKEYGGQVVIFSCQSREEQLLKENGLTFNPIHL